MQGGRAGGTPLDRVITPLDRSRPPTSGGARGSSVTSASGQTASRGSRSAHGPAESGPAPRPGSSAHRPGTQTHRPSSEQRAGARTWRDVYDYGAPTEAAIAPVSVPVYQPGRKIATLARVDAADDGNVRTMMREFLNRPPDRWA